jgi:hypothetical protein
LKKFGLFIGVLLIFTLAFFIMPNAIASPDIVYSDLEDGVVYNTGSTYSGEIWVGDETTQTIRGLVKFNLASVPRRVSSATLNLYLFQCRYDDNYDTTSPLTNIGLGDCQVIHIDDYGTLSSGDYNDPSIGNDPGVLISSSATPNIGYVSIDVTAAMNDDIDNGRSFTAFLIRMASDTDGDGLRDRWEFQASEYSGTGQDPYIEYELVPENPVGGIYASNDKLNILAPYIALVGLIGAISTIFVIRKWRKD